MNLEKTTFKIKLGKKISETRKLKSYTQNELAICLGVSRGLISKVELGINSPSFELLYKICTMLKCDIFDLLPKNTEIKPNDFNCL